MKKLLLASSLFLSSCVTAEFTTNCKDVMKSFVADAKEDGFTSQSAQAGPDYILVVLSKVESQDNKMLVFLKEPVSAENLQQIERMKLSETGTCMMNQDKARYYTND